MPSNKPTPRIPTIESYSPMSLMPSRLRDLLGDSFPDFIAPTVGWVPAVEVTEKGNELVVTCELAGMKKEDVEIVLQNNVLTIRGEKREEKNEQREGNRYLVYERSYGTFARSFTLPSSVSADKALATFEHGVLTIRIPKSPESKDRTIPIKD